MSTNQDAYSSEYIERMAMTCHQINKAYCETLGDTSQPDWKDAPDWQKQSAVMGVGFHLTNPNAKPEDSHNSWLKEKEATGWKHGPVKDAEKKEHPCYVPYDQLPKSQQVKDVLFIAVVHAMK